MKKGYVHRVYDSDEVIPDWCPLKHGANYDLPVKEKVE